MVAPKGPGHLVRRTPTPKAAACPACSPCIRTPPAKRPQKALAYAKGIGGTRSGVIETTFKEETETDLFGEQAVLCGGVTELIRPVLKPSLPLAISPKSYF